MAFTQKCRVGTLVVPNSGLVVSVHQDSRHSAVCVSPSAPICASSLSSATEYSLEVLRARGTRRTGSSWTWKLDLHRTCAIERVFNYGATVQNSCLPFYRVGRQSQVGSSCLSSFWGIDKDSFRIRKYSLGYTKIFQSPLDCQTNGPVYHRIPASFSEGPRFDDEEGVELVDRPEKGRDNGVSESKEGNSGPGQRNGGASLKGTRPWEKNDFASSTIGPDGSFVRQDSGLESDSDNSDLFYGESDNSTWRSKWDNGQGYTEYDERKGESWEEESVRSTQDEIPGSVGSAADSLAIGGKEPVYQVLEVNPDGDVVKREVSRRQLLRSSGLRLRDIRSVDPSLWVTNSVPALLVRDEAILLNLGSLRAIANAQSVLVFDENSVGAQAFMEALLPRLHADNNGHGPAMPFELEVVEAALISRTRRLEKMLMDVEPRVLSLLKVLPNRLTADGLEELRLSKQALVELGAKAGALRQMLLEILEHPQDIRRMTIIGRTCHVRRDDGSVECSLPVDKQFAEDEEQEIEMLLEYYLQRCDSCHGQAEKLLNSAKEMEDSIAVNLSSRRLEVSRLELLLQVGTFCSALGALVAGIFGMNLRSYLEEHLLAFWITTAGIIFGGIGLVHCHVHISQGSTDL